MAAIGNEFPTNLGKAYKEVPCQQLVVRKHQSNTMFLNKVRFGGSMIVRVRAGGGSGSSLLDALCRGN